MQDPTCMLAATRLHDQPALEPGIQILYVTSLKALINDQYQRLLDTTENTAIPVHRWHGDVAADRKHKVLKEPDGILLLTPESLEAMFVLRGTKVPGTFGNLRYVVVDELHDFLGTESGAQLRSQLHRLELVARRTIVRIGLSAILGDMSLAAAQLRPGASQRVALVESADGGQELGLAVRGYINKPAPPAAATTAVAAHPGAGQDPDAGGEADDDEPDDRYLTERQIAGHLFAVLRGADNLVFANSRKNVEEYADRLRVLCEQANLPNEFFPHHGILSRDLREEVEAALRAPGKPTTAVATTTLEMGVDIGSVTSIAQIGAPPSVREPAPPPWPVWPARRARDPARVRHRIPGRSSFPRSGTSSVAVSSKSPRCSSCSWKGGASRPTRQSCTRAPSSSNC